MLLTVIFTIMKLFGAISWPWAWVLSPLWIAGALLLVILLVAFIVMIAMECQKIIKTRRILDEHAKRCGIDRRPGETDAELRARIVQTVKNAGNMTTKQDIKDIIMAYFPQALDVKVNVYPDKATLDIEVEVKDASNNSRETVKLVEQLLRERAPMGLRFTIDLRTANPYKGKIAYSQYFKSYIRATGYTDDDTWWFAKCKTDGRVIGRIMKAKIPASSFDWRDIEKEANNNE